MEPVKLYEEILNHLQLQRETGRVGAIGDGTILKWIIAHKEEIIQIIPIIISLFGQDKVQAILKALLK